MAFIPLPDCVKIELIFRKNNAPVVNVLWGKSQVTIDAGYLEAVAVAVRDWWNTSMKSLTVGTMALEEVRVTDWTTNTGLQHVEPVVPALSGTNVGADMPSNLAAVVSFGTGFRGRSNRGRVYLAGTPEGSVTGNQFTSAYLTAIIEAMVDFGAALNTVDTDHVVASFYSENAPRVTGVWKTVTEYSGNNVVDTQRRRIPRVFQ